LILDFCGWTNVPPKTNRNGVLWTRNSGKTESDNSGLLSDHTTGTADGWYVYVPLDSQSNGVAILQSELLSYGPTVCLRFFYHMLVENNIFAPKLKVMYSAPGVPTPVVVTIIVDHRFNRWSNFNKTLTNMPQNFRFMLQTFEGNISRADVAVDDIQVKAGTCDQAFVTTSSPVITTQVVPVGERQWDCNFEGPNCNWNIDINWNKTWWWPSM
jgi:hypothetical protein